MTTLRRLRTLSLTLLLASLLTPPVASAADDAEQKDLVDKSRMTLNSFLTDTNMDWFREHI
ncbi:hypothetical protein [Petrachloros mirabilis]